jgi:uncharacterized membrane protein YqjE
VAADSRADGPLADSLAGLATGPRDVARWLLVIGGNRLELLAAELEEERDHLLHMMMLALGMAVFALLFCIVATGAVVLALWAHGPVVVLAILAVLYLAMVFLIRRLFIVRTQDWRAFAASIDQLRRDRDEIAGRLS